ncbi:hypothetical protein TrST_g6177 [Triparma strigata]|uniref:Bud22 domain-containing protein n=1 Tax=Triparma strigata TaxID=1606541 RepID=A0A9W7C6B7_9STRA|nr:hypothetical protein TrST_g6177 [Triparma strigata]
MPTLGPKRKKPRAAASSDEATLSSSQIVYSPMERITHKSELELRRAAKKALGFETQKSIKRLKELQQSSPTPPTKSSTKKLNAATRNLSLVKAVSVDLLASVSLRRLGVKHTGVGNDPLTNLPPDSDAEGVKKIVERCIGNNTFKKVMDELNVKIVEVRKREMERSEAPKSKKGKKRAREDRKVTGSEWSKGYQGQQGVFLNLNGSGEDSDGDEDEEGGKRVSQYGPNAFEDGDDEWANVTSKKNRKGQRARQAKAKAVAARKRGEKWDSSVNWRAKKEKEEEVEDSGLKKDEIVLKATVGAGGKKWQDKGKAHPSWAAKKVEKGIVEFKGTKVTFN